MNEVYIWSLVTYDRILNIITHSIGIQCVGMHLDQNIVYIAEEE